MRLSALTVAFLVAGGIGCSDKGTGGSVGTTSTGGGDNSDAGMMGGGSDGGMSPGDMGLGGGGGGGVGGGHNDMGKIGPGPWPLDDLHVYGAADGLGGGIVDANPDDAQNIWAANGETLYVLRPGSSTFQAFTAADGLHIGPFTDPYGQPNETRITAIAGGAGGQVYVGYYGYETLGNPFDDTEAQKELGNGDDVTLSTSGTIGVTRLLFRCDAERAAGCWENRSPRRIIYSHLGVASGHSWWGFNHGVTHVLADDFGDHIHPEVWYTPPDGGTDGTEKLGEFYGIAPDASGNLWMAGRYAVGLQPWNPLPHGSDPDADEWVSGHFLYAFTVDTSDHSLGNEAGPWVTSGYQENNRGAAVTPDGRLWLARLGGGLVSWDPSTRNYNTIQHWSQPPSDLMDVQADVDGTLWLVDSGGTLYRFDPGSGALTAWAGVGGVTRIYVDSTVTPRAVYASMSGGVAVIRAK
ncbi:MAG TPA: hypothetical protein VGL86_05940 [Polyangia bacterium]|jgi:hypothetical protein